MFLPRRSLLVIAALAVTLVQPAQSEADNPTRIDLYGDPLPVHAISRFGTVRLRHTGTAIAFAPDGKKLASSGRYGDPDIHIWDVTTGRELNRFTGHQEGEEVVALAYSPDGKILASSRNSERPEPLDIRLWDTTTGKQLHRFKQGASYLVFSPDSRTLISGDDINNSNVDIWNVQTGERVRQLSNHDWKSSFALSPDGKVLATGHDKMIAVWSLPDGKKVGEFRDTLTSWVGFLAWSPDGKTLASAEKSGTKIRLLEFPSGKNIKQLAVPDDGWNFITSVAFAPDGRTLVAGYRDSVIRLWDNATGKILRQFHGHVEGRSYRWVQAIFSPDGKQLASAGLDRTIRFWDVNTGRELQPRIGHEGEVWGVSWLPDGKTIASAGDLTLRLWDAASANEFRRFKGHTEHVFCLAVSRDSRLIASGGRDMMVRLWDVRTGRELHQLPGHKQWVMAVAFSSDGKILASAGGDNTIRLWDVATGKEVRQFQDTAEGTVCVIFTPDGNTLALGNSRSQTIRRWDVKTGKELALFQCQANSLAFSPDGKTLAVVTGDQGIVLWDMITARQITTFSNTKAGISCMAFSPEGRTILAGGEDGTIRMWDLLTEKECGTFVGHQGEVRSVCYSPDGKQFVSGSKDTTALVWDVSRPLKERQDRQVIPSPQELQAVWSDLASPDASKGYKAVLTLATSPQQAVPFVKERFQAIRSPDPKRISRLIDTLDDGQFTVREEAAAELEKLGGFAESALRKVFQENPSLEVRRRVEKLLNKLDQGISHPDLLQALRAIAALEQIGTAEAQEVIRILVNDTFMPRVRQEATSSLDRLAKRNDGKP